MSRHAAESWSFGRALAFLAAVLAMSVGALAPAAVAASAATDAPIVVCSAGKLLILHDGGTADGDRQQDDSLAGLTCAMALLSGLAALEPTPPLEIAASLATPEPVRFARPTRAAPAMPRPAPRPPSTAPPHS